jgi:hypothetical protein
LGLAVLEVYCAEDGAETQSAIAAVLARGDALYRKKLIVPHQVYDVSFELTNGDLPGAIDALKANPARAPPGSHAAKQLRRSIAEFGRALELELDEVDYAGESSRGGHVRVSKDHFAKGSKARHVPERGEARSITTRATQGCE